MNWRSKRDRRDRPTVLATPVATRALRGALWLFVAVGAVGGLLAAVRPTTTVVQPVAEEDVSLPSGALGTAELAVRDWLVREGRPSRAGAPTILTVDAIAAVAVREIETDYWAITVGATVRDSETSAPHHWYLEIGVADTNDGPRPVGRPAIVPPPTTLAALDGPSLTLTVPAPDDPTAATADAFLQALLTGNGDPVRYVAPNANIGPLEEPPFVVVTLQRMAVVSTTPNLTTRVALTGTTADGLAFELLYELTLAERDGRWEVLALTGAPARVVARVAQPSTTAGTSPTTSQPTAPTPGA